MLLWENSWSLCCCVRVMTLRINNLKARTKLLNQKFFRKRFTAWVMSCLIKFITFVCLWDVSFSQWSFLKATSSNVTKIQNLFYLFLSQKFILFPYKLVIFSPYLYSITLMTRNKPDWMRLICTTNTWQTNKEIAEFYFHQQSLILNSLKEVVS